MQSNQDENLNTNESSKVKSVIRICHNKENPFVLINKQTLWDANLSLKAIGLWARCMSMPDDWKFSVKKIISQCKEGKEAVYAAIKELILQKYAVRFSTPPHNENGSWIGGVSEYVFFEFKATDEDIEKEREKFKSLHPDNSPIYSKNNYRNPGFQDPGNQDLLILNKTKYTEIQQQQTQKSLNELPQKTPPSAKAETPKGVVVVFPVFEEIQIPFSEKKKLSQELTQEKANQLIKRLTRWKNRPHKNLKAIRAILKNWDNWDDEPTNEELEDKKEAENKLMNKLVDSRKSRALAIKAQFPNDPIEITDQIWIKLSRGMDSRSFREERCDSFMDLWENRKLKFT